MRHTRYSPLEWLTTVAVVIGVWACFIVAVGFLFRATKELFCVGFGC